jgi:ATP-dependent DNA helicase RecG
MQRTLRFLKLATMRSLDDPAKFVRGVGPRGAERLASLQIYTVGDLLRHIPRRYEDRTAIRAIGDLMPNETAVVRGMVLAAEGVRTTRKGLSLTRVVIGDDTGTAELVFFRQPYLLQKFQQMLVKRRSVVVFGAVRSSGYGRPTFEHPEWEEWSPDEDALSTGCIVPVYPLAEGLTQKWLRAVMAAALETHGSLVQDALPEDLALRYNLMDLASAYRCIHRPQTFEEVERARRRLVFEEFFVLQAGLAVRRIGRATQAQVPIISVAHDDVCRLAADVFPFELTKDQLRAIEEIAADMASGRQMNRLLHGDVGSGKTAVAVAAIVLAVRGGHQAAIMAPTEILAQQQASVLSEWLGRVGLQVEIATGSLSVRARTELRERLASGQAQVVVGTHALIEEDVQFRSLGLVIIDEQHRFGVRQRQALQAKGAAPHVLVMSATPIPRTLTLTLYGDLEVTALRDMPPRRGTIKTYWKRPDEAPAVYRGVAELLSRGRQAYVVCPLVEESESLEVTAAAQHAERISREMLPNYRVGLLHGQMTPDAKESTMAAFKRGDLDVLVSTTVIEVGIDVPNASVMVVEDADRFGLAQLHQLRGRVGRGRHASYCILIADPKTESGIRRMQVMVETRDGFRIAEEDLRLRGPGECLGTRQSGLPEFHFGDLIRDEETLIETRRAAEEVVKADPDLALPGHSALRAAVESRLDTLDLAKVS